MTKIIPCVGFELLYSPLDRDNMENIAHQIHSKSNRFIFDVVAELTTGQEVLILFSNQHGPTEHLYAEVTHCVRLAEKHYQVGLETQPNANVIIDNASLVSLPINKGPATAREIILSCPSCKNSTSFRFVANQNGDWETGILPIYNCSSCGTTRAIIGMVA
ncbi:MAG: hypothetical protein OEZ01_17055 [Candidatus Heimdallarchaeota archaeon]|nr:hypothetical protein [Candidatus Heimdallarchaeota archaeon]